MPRRYHAYPDEFQVLHVISTAGASILGSRLHAAADLSDLVAALRPASPGPNPWGATGLEWQTSSPPPTHNFDETPVVTHEAYDYSGLRGGQSWLAHAHNGHPLGLREHFDSPEQQRDAATLGMWVFLVTEIMFFGGMFTAYTVYRAWYPNVFAVREFEFERGDRRCQHGGASLQQFHHGDGSARGFAGREKIARRIPDPDHGSGRRFFGREGLRVEREVR